ncbi:hypothetical protein HYALB_00013557 [Hymenoscyphus albidus]|uniref:Uncharacterized protein n=1 Tax=Hymenoscyphus albidus TaxID=595503 RepID=A0A9N9LRQ9_9HELO|nr:hypothetical protein HYALB_00013557 [Hymenoscyphus albidus]
MFALGCGFLNTCRFADVDGKLTVRPASHIDQSILQRRHLEKRLTRSSEGRKYQYADEKRAFCKIAEQRIEGNPLKTSLRQTGR